MDAGQDAQILSPLVSSLLISELRLARAIRFLSQGEFLPGSEEGFVEYQPAAREIPRLQREVRAGLDALGLGIAARARLEASKPAQTGGLVAAILAGNVEEGGNGDD